MERTSPGAHALANCVQLGLLAADAALEALTHPKNDGLRVEARAQLEGFKASAEQLAKGPGSGG